MPAPDPRVLIDDEVWPQLTRLAARKRRGPAIVVVPYATAALLDLRHGDTLVVDLSVPTLAAGQVNPTILRQYLRAGVALHSSPGLHAKMFVLGDTAVIGSSNMSNASEQNLREAVVVLRNAPAVRAARQAAERLIGPEISAEDLSRLAVHYRPPVRTRGLPLRPSSSHPAGPPPNPDDRLWIIGVYDAEWPATALERATAERRSIRRRAGRAADVEIGSALWDADVAPTLKRDDVLIEGWAAGEREPLGEALHPARVLDVVPIPGTGRSKGWVIVYWRRPAKKPHLPWGDLQQAVRHAGGRLGDDSTLVRRVTSSAQRNALLDLWGARR